MSEKQTTPKRLDAYIRVSKVNGREGESFQSPGEQERAIRDALARKGYEVGEVNAEDLDQSGGVLDRPGFQRVLRRIEAGEIDGIAVIRADRFARSVKVAWDAVERIQTAGGIFFSATEEIDLFTAAGKAIFNTLMMVAQYQRDMATEQWGVAVSNAMDRGVHIGPTPFGYTRAVNAKGKAYGPLLPHPEYAKYVGEVFRRRALGASWSELARYLTARAPSVRGASWSIKAPQYMIRNRTYLGEINYGGKRRPGSHEAIVTEAEWAAANRSRARGRPRHTTWLLAGLLRCAGCRYTLKGKRMASGRYYRCTTSAEAAVTCPAPAGVNADQAEQWLEHLAYERHKEILLDSLQGGVDFDEAESELAEAEHTYAEMARMMAESSRPELMEPALKEAEARLAAAGEELERLRSLGAVGGLPRLFPLDELWGGLTVEERRGHLGDIFDAVFVKRSTRRGRASIPIWLRAKPLYRGEGPDDLPGRGKFVPLRSFDWNEDEIGEATLKTVGEATL